MASHGRLQVYCWLHLCAIQRSTFMGTTAGGPTPYGVFIHMINQSRMVL